MAYFYTIGNTDIEDIYSRIRTRNERALTDRRRKLFTEYPELNRLDREIVSTNTSTMRRIVTLSPDAAASVRAEGKAKTRDLREQFDRILSDNGYPADYLARTYDCPLCKDEGTVDGKRCICYQKYMMELLYRQSGLADVLEKENFGTFSFDYYSDEPQENRPSPRKCIEIYHSKAKEFATTDEPKGQSFLFYGRTGVGKTFLSNCIAAEMMAHGRSVLYLTANELFYDILSPYYMPIAPDQRERVKPVYNLIYSSHLLVIDDLGTENTTNFTRSQLFEIINRRMLQNRSTVISTNLPLQQFGERYEDRILSRIVERYEICHFYGEDIRSKKKTEALKATVE